jgi:glycosyltransferase involved in cell wall biosynthesis
LLTPTVLPGDAVSADILGMCRWFRRRGHEAHVYSSRRHHTLRRRVRPLRLYEPYLGRHEDLLIYHHSVGWPAGLRLFERSCNVRIGKHHNVTPAVFYRPYNALYVRACDKGAVETVRLLECGAELWLADSEFNRQQLIALGAEPDACRVVPPFHEVERLREGLEHEALAAKLRGRTSFLFVGRMAPNKGHLHLIRALAHYRHYLGGQGRLFFIGAFDPGVSNYRECLLREIRRLRVDGHVHFVGKVSRRRLRTYYRHADAFLCLSEHEGFCVPLVEAMHFGVPIVAYGSSAVAYTLADGALVWDTPAPARIADSMRLIEEDSGVRQCLVRAQRARFAAHFSMAAIERQFEESLAPILDGAHCHA